MRLSAEQVCFVAWSDKKVQQKENFSVAKKNFRNFNFVFFAAAEFVDVKVVVEEIKRHRLGSRV